MDCFAALAMTNSGGGLFLRNLHHRQHRLDLHLAPGADRQLGHGPVEGRGERVLHLHRLEHHEPLPGGDRITLRHIDRDDLARHGGDDVAVVGVVVAGATGPIQAVLPRKCIGERVYVVAGLTVRSIRDSDFIQFVLIVSESHAQAWRAIQS